MNERNRAADQVTLTIGDLAVAEADVIVNAANTALVMGGGVARDLLNEAGAEVEEEAVQQGPVAVGDVVLTSAGNLAAGHMLHVAVVGEHEPDLYECTRNVLERATDLGARTLAMPALGTGSAGVPVSTAAEAILQALSDFFDETGSDLAIQIVIYDEQMFDAFELHRRRFV